MGENRVLHSNTQHFCKNEYFFIINYSRPAIERPGLESQRSRKRLFFHRKIFKFFKYFFIIVGISLDNLINIRKKFVFLFQLQISIFRISCHGWPPEKKIVFYCIFKIFRKIFCKIKKLSYTKFYRNLVRWSG